MLESQSGELELDDDQLHKGLPPVAVRIVAMGELTVYIFMNQPITQRWPSCRPSASSLGERELGSIEERTRSRMMKSRS